MFHLDTPLHFSLHSLAKKVDGKRKWFDVERSKEGTEDLRVAATFTFKIQVQFPTHDVLFLLAGKYAFAVNNSNNSVKSLKENCGFFKVFSLFQIGNLLAFKKNVNS